MPADPNQPNHNPKPPTETPPPEQKAVEASSAGEPTTLPHSPVAASSDGGPDTPPPVFVDSAAQPNSLPDIPGYAVEAEIAHGGMGVVYRARHLKLNRSTAIKMILGGKYQGPEAHARFTIEAEAIAALNHPHIVSVYEFGTHEGLPYFALEYIGGGTLAQKLKRDGKPTPRAAVDLLVKLADAVASAHAKGIVHRDLKPANIMLTESGEPKVTDFGLARVGESDMTASGAIMGTPSYMAPEQAGGRTKEIGAHTDVYALGAVLYECLTGRPPFRDEDPLVTLEQVRSREPNRPRASDPTIPRDLEIICLKCLEKDPAKRYPTANQFLDDLVRYQGGRPILARPIGHAERTLKWVRRNPVVTALLTMVILALAGGTAFSTIYAFREKRAREAEAARAVGEAQARQLAEERAEAEASANKVAQEALLLADHRLYAGTLAEVQTTWERGDRGRAQRLLRRCALDYRGWEHDYLATLISSDQALLETFQNTVSGAMLSKDGSRMVIQQENGEIYTRRLDSVERQTLSRVMKVEGNPTVVALSHDGDKLLVQTQLPGETNQVRKTPRGWRVWDAQSDREICTLRDAHDCFLGEFSPDGSRVVMRSVDRDCGVWDAVHGTLVYRLSETKGAKVRFGPQGDQLLTFGVKTNKGGSVRVWNARDGRLLHSLAHPHSVDAARFAPSGRRIATYGHSHVQEPERRGKPGKVAEAQTFGTDSRGNPISPTEGKTVWVWDSASGQQLHALEHDREVGLVLFSPDGSRIATAQLDNEEPRGNKAARTIGVYDARSGRILFQVEHRTSVRCLAFSPDGLRIAIGSGSYTFESRDLDEKRPPHRSFPDWPGVVEIVDGWTGEKLDQFELAVGNIDSIVFCPRGNRIVISSVTQKTWLSHRRTGLKELYDGALRVWNIGTRQSGVLHQGSIPVTDIAFSRDGRRVIVGSEDGSVQLWDVIARQKLPTPKGQGHSTAVASVAFFGEEGQEQVVSCSTDGTILAQSGQSTRTIQALNRHNQPPASMAVSPDGRYFAVVCPPTKGNWSTEYRVLKLFDGASGKLLAHGIEGGDALAFGPDGTRLAIGGHSRSGREAYVFVFDLLTLKPEPTEYVDRKINAKKILSNPWHRGSATSIAFSPDGKWIVSGSEDGGIVVLEVKSGIHRFFRFNPRAGRVTGVAFVPGEDRVAGCFEDGTIQIINYGTQLGSLTLRGHTDAVTCIAFSRDGRTLVSGSKDGTVRIWDASLRLEWVGTMVEHQPRVSALYGRQLAGSRDGRYLATPVPTGAIGGPVRRPVDIQLCDLTSGRSKLLRHTTSPSWLAEKAKSQPGGILPTGFSVWGHPLKGLAFSEDGKQLMVSSEIGMSVAIDGKEKSEDFMRTSIWDTESGALQSTVETPETINLPAPVEGRFRSFLTGTMFDRGMSRLDTVLQTQRIAHDRAKVLRWANADSAWHQRMAREAAASDRPYAAEFHRGQLAQIQP